MFKWKKVVWFSGNPFTRITNSYRCYWYITWSKIICNRVLEDQIPFLLFDRESGEGGIYTLIHAHLDNYTTGVSVQQRESLARRLSIYGNHCFSCCEKVCSVYCPRISQRKMCSFAFGMKLSLFLISWPNLLHYLPHSPFVEPQAATKALQPIFPSCRTPSPLHRCAPPYAHLVILTAWNNLQNIGRYTRTLLHSNVVGWRMG